MTSRTARRMVAIGCVSAEDAVEALCAAADRYVDVPAGSEVACVECGALFVRFVPPHYLTHVCGEECQVRRNEAIFDLDGGRTILIVGVDITSARAAELLADVGIVAHGAGGVRPS